MLKISHRLKNLTLQVDFYKYELSLKFIFWYSIRVYLNKIVRLIKPPVIMPLPDHSYI